MKIKSLMLLAISTVLILSSCARIYHAPDASNIAKKHQEVAIITPQVLLTPRPFVSQAAMQDMQFNEAINLQFEMYDWLLRRQFDGRFMDVKIQDVVQTNKILEKKGFFDGEIYSHEELCELLGVDAILFSTYTLDSPFDVATVALAVLSEDYDPQQETSVNLSIFDNTEGKVIWNYRNSFRESVTTPNQFIASFMRHASKKMPYSLKKS